MEIKPIRAKLRMVGNSWVVVVPKDVVELFGLQGKTIEYTLTEINA